MTMRNPLIWLGGGDSEVLEQCPPGQARRVAAYGGTILFTGVLAGIAAAFATRSWFHVGGFAAVVAGLVWGIGILNLDRMLFMALTRQSSWWRTLLLALPRVALAILVGRVVAEPVMQKLFDAEITQQALGDRNSKAAAQQKALERQFESIQDLKGQRKALRAKLRHQPVADVLAHDDAYQALQRRIDAAQRRAYRLSSLASCELDGSCGSEKVGSGPAYKDKLRRAQQAENEVNRLEARQAGLRRRLIATNSRNRVQVINQARGDLRRVRHQLEVQTKRYDARSKKLEGAATAPIGYLDRAKALDELSAEQSVVARKALLFAIFITVLDCLPVIIKALVLLGQPSLYEEIEEEVRLRRLNGSRTETDAQDAARRIEAEMIMEDAETRRELTRNATRDIHARVLEVQREAALAYIERWREAVLEQTDGWVDDHLRRHARPRRHATQYAGDPNDDGPSPRGRFRR